MAIQIRRGTESEWEAGKQNIVVGEPCVTTDTGRFFVGTEDGFSEMARMEDIGAFEESIETLQGEVEDLNEALETKADKTDTYSKEDVDGLLEGKASTEALEELSEQLDSKADSSAVYTKTETDTLLSGKASASDLEELEEEMTDYRQMYLDSLIHTTASGAIASFSDGFKDAPMDFCTASIEPVQDLHGQANPYPAGGGKNILQNVGTSKTESGITFTVNEDGTVNVNGTATAETNLEVYGGLVLPSGSYILNGCPSGGSTSTYRIFATNFGSDTGSGLTINADGTTSTIIRINIKSGTAINNLVFKPMIRLSSVTDATFAPYSNICPISGWTGANVVRCGGNILDTSDFTHNAYNIGSIPNNLVPNAQYTWAIKGTTTYQYRLYLAKSGTPQTADVPLNAGYIGQGSVQTFTAPADMTDYDLLCIAGNRNGAGNESMDAILPMLSGGSVSASVPYEPYTADTYSVTWESEAGTVYGGSVDLVSGVLTVTHGIRLFDGSESWTMPSTGYFALALDNLVNDNSRATIISDRFLGDSWTRIAGLTIDNAVGVVNGTTIRFSYSTLSAVADWKSWLNTNNTAVVYELAEPIVYQLSGQDIVTLLGQNNVWADTGDMACGYVANTKLYIDSRI